MTVEQKRAYWREMSRELDRLRGVRPLHLRIVEWSREKILRRLSRLTDQKKRAVRKWVSKELNEIWLKECERTRAERRKERNRRKYEMRKLDPLRRHQKRKNARKRRKYATDPAYRARVKAALKAASKKPESRLWSSLRKSFKELLSGEKRARKFGYTRAQLAAHLERQFVRGMTWENYGTRWHVDHITPLAAFEPGDMGAWCLSNLRPLWAKANIEKSDSRVYLC